VDATIALLAAGGTPSVDDVAKMAEVSRRTVYLYFPTFDQLLIDATLGALSQAGVDRAIEGDADGGSVEDRVERAVRALTHLTPDVERLGRALIRLTVDPQPGRPVQRRGYRRIEWIESALAPWRHRLDAAAWRRLVCALAMVTGWEALIVQRDVCGLSSREGEELSVWAARAFLRETLKDEAPEASGAKRGRSRSARAGRPNARQ
jgi:AcrR family transcriptional regulator